MPKKNNTALDGILLDDGNKRVQLFDLTEVKKGNLNESLLGERDGYIDWFYEAPLDQHSHCQREKGCGNLREIQDDLAELKNTMLTDPANLFIDYQVSLKNSATATEDICHDAAPMRRAIHSTDTFECRKSGAP